MPSHRHQPPLPPWRTPAIMSPVVAQPSMCGKWCRRFGGLRAMGVVMWIIMYTWRNFLCSLTASTRAGTPESALPCTLRRSECAMVSSSDLPLRGLCQYHGGSAPGMDRGVLC